MAQLAGNSHFPPARELLIACPPSSLQKQWHGEEQQAGKGRQKAQALNHLPHTQQAVMLRHAVTLQAHRFTKCTCLTVKQARNKRILGILHKKVLRAEQNRETDVAAVYGSLWVLNLRCCWGRVTGGAEAALAWRPSC